MAHGELRQRGIYWFCKITFWSGDKRRVKEWRSGTNKAEARKSLNDELNKLNGFHVD